MSTLMLGRQTERVGIVPTLSVVVAKGIASPKVSNQQPRHICKEYANNGSNPLSNFPLYHFIITLPPRPKIGLVLRQMTYIYHKEQNQCEECHFPGDCPLCGAK